MPGLPAKTRMIEGRKLTTILAVLLHQRIIEMPLRLLGRQARADAAPSPTPHRRKLVPLRRGPAPVAAAAAGLLPAPPDVGAAAAAAGLALSASICGCATLRRRVGAPQGCFMCRRGAALRRLGACRQLCIALHGRLAGCGGSGQTPRPAPCLWHPRAESLAWVTGTAECDLLKVFSCRGRSRHCALEVPLRKEEHEQPRRGFSVWAPRGLRGSAGQVIAWLLGPRPLACCP